MLKYIENNTPSTAASPGENDALARPNPLLKLPFVTSVWCVCVHLMAKCSLILSFQKGLQDHAKSKPKIQSKNLKSHPTTPTVWFVFPLGMS